MSSFFIHYSYTIMVNNMDKKESFKEFAKRHPELIEHVNKGSMTWQKFYEIYDIYGEDDKVWNEYRNNKNTINPDDITKKLKSIDMNSIQDHIRTAQKALSIVSELTGKQTIGKEVTSSIPKVPRPINKFFED